MKGTKLESIDDFFEFNEISLLIVDRSRFSAISSPVSGTTRISNALVNFQFSRCGKIHPKMKSTACARKKILNISSTNPASRRS